MNVRERESKQKKGIDYCCVIYGISKSKAINFLKSSVIDDKGCI